MGVQVGDERVAIVEIDGRLYAIRDECSHARIMLSVGEVDPDDHTIECYGHSARFSLETGEALDLPATVPVPVYPAIFDGADVLVDLDNPIQEH